MNKKKLPKFMVSAKRYMRQHSPEFLIGIGIAGMTGAAVLAVKGTPKALELIEAKKREENKDKLTPIETVKVTWKCYVPAVIAGVSSAGCLILANSVHARRHAALATAYKLSESAFTEYREKVIETIGEKKEHNMQEKLDADRIERAAATNNEVLPTHCGRTLCLDPTSGRFFESDIDHIKKAENELNSRMIHDLYGYCTLNEFYDELDIPHTDVGEIIGWNVHKLIKIRIGSGITPEGMPGIPAGQPCIVVNHDNAPFYEFDKHL